MQRFERPLFLKNSFIGICLHNFTHVTLKTLFIMKAKFLLILVSVFLPLSLFAQNNDNDTDRAKIPLYQVSD